MFESDLLKLLNHSPLSSIELDLTDDLNQLSSCDDKLCSTVRLQLAEIERSSDSDS